MKRPELIAAATFFGIAILFQSTALGGLVFNYTLGADLVALQTSNAALANQVVTGFQSAGNQWSNRLGDNIQINMTINYASLGAGILGSTSSSSIGVTYSNVRTALAADAKSATDTQAVANLPVGTALSFQTNDRAGAQFFDNDGSANNIVLDVNTANAKALGLLAANSAGQDGSVTFSSNFNFDFDPTNGISAGQFDFVGIAAHEIGHALGFVSGVDTVDAFSGAGPNAGTDLNGAAAGIGTLDPFRVFSVLDLYRYSAAGVLDFSVGGTKYFSLDAGTTNLGLFATGSFNGDGRQASHFKDNLGLGIMDPTAAPGELLVISNLDLRAFDAMGYDLITAVPEPSTLALVSLGALGMYFKRRKKQPTID